jgi:hypothetical protein
MMGRIVLATCLAGASVAVLGPALAEPNGRPPPIKLSQPSPTPSASATPIKIGKPAPTPTPTPKPVGAEGLSGVDVNKMIDVALKMPLQPSVYQWQAGQPAVQLQPAATHICVLTGVSGKFRGGGERVELAVDMAAAGGPRYMLSGNSGQAQLRANAVCVRKDRFTPAMTGGDAKVTHAHEPLMVHMGCSTARKVFTKPGPDYAHVVREFGGKFDGLGDFVRTAGNSLYVSGCAGYVGGSASAIHMIDSGPVKYLGPTGRTTNDLVARYYATLDNPAPGQEKVTPMSIDGGNRLLVPASDALCGLAEVGGRFLGYGEAAEIVMTTYNGALWWKAQISNAQAGSGVTMAVRCIARDQR